MLDHRLILVIGFTVLIHAISTLGYAVRLAGVRTQRLALAFSLWNVIFLLSSTANTIQAPFLGRMIDQAGLAVSKGSSGVLEIINGDLRIVIMAATFGAIIGTIFLPSFVRLFTKGIFLFERTRSIPKMITLIFHPKMVKAILASVKIPNVETIRRASKGQGIPRKIIFLNFLVTGVWTIGVLSALYAGLLDIRYVRTTANMSGLINGVATIMGVMLVDPHVASITDEAARGLRSDEDIRAVSMQLAFSRIAGTIVAQFMFVPAAKIIVYFAGIL